MTLIDQLKYDGRQLVYFIGHPGSGKTTLMSETTKDDPVNTIAKKPFAHTIYESGLVELGYQRPTYGGTDTLALGVQPKVAKWLENPPEYVGDTVLGEGDRLATLKFFRSAMDAGWNLTVVYLHTSELRARQQAWERGSRFDESWLRGRITKVDNLRQHLILVHKTLLSVYRKDDHYPNLDFIEVNPVDDRGTWVFNWDKSYYMSGRF